MNQLRIFLTAVCLALLAAFTIPDQALASNKFDTQDTISAAPAVHVATAPAKSPLGPLGSISLLGFALAGATEAKKLAARKLTLDRTYLFNDVLYGPGRNVEVPEGFPEIDDEGNVVHEPGSTAERNALRMRTPAPAGTNALSDRTVSGQSLEELQALSKEELVALAEELEVEVSRGDEGEGEPLKSDYVTALSAPQAGK